MHGYFFTSIHVLKGMKDSVKADYQKFSFLVQIVPKYREINLDKKDSTKQNRTSIGG